jgi:putative aminopeptidase FrvX
LYLPVLKNTFNDIEHVIAKTVEYLSIPSVVGHEQYFMHHLKQDFEKLGLSATVHPGVLEVHGRDPQAAIVCAHVDRHGLISIGGCEYVYAAQYMKEIKYGENNRNSQEEIKSISARFEGERLFAYDPKTGETIDDGIIQSCSPWKLKGDALFEVRDMRIIEQGLPLAYARTAEIQNDYIKGQLDNVISVATIYGLFKDGFQGTALLSAEEEIGKSWVHINRFLERNHIETRNLIVLDTSPYSDADPIKDGYIIFRNRDYSEVFDTELTAALQTRCREIELPFHCKDEYLITLGRTVDQLGSTELGKVIKNSKGRWSGSTVQIPTLMYHTSSETTSRTALKNFYGYLKNILIDDPLPLSIKKMATA